MTTFHLAVVSLTHQGRGAEDPILLTNADKDSV